MATTILETNGHFCSDPTTTNRPTISRTNRKKTIRRTVQNMSFVDYYHTSVLLLVLLSLSPKWSVLQSSRSLVGSSQPSSSTSSWSLLSTILVQGKKIKKEESFKKQYMYLSETKDITPLKEYKARVPPREDGIEVATDKPAFLYDPSYPYPRLVEFYAPWCPHCQHFKDRYIQFAKTMDVVTASLTPRVYFETHAVSCVANRPICTDHRIAGYPTLYLYPAHSINFTSVSISQLHPFRLLQKLNITSPIENSSDGGLTLTGANSKSNTKQIRTDGGGALRTSNNNKPPQDGDGLMDDDAQLMAKHAPPVPYFMDRSKTEIYNDAHLSFDFAMRTAIYTISHGPLSDKHSDALYDWLELLQKTLHPFASLQPLLVTLLDDFDSISQSDANLTKVMNQYPPPVDEWSPACLQHGTGYTCGLWQLLHMISIGMVEWNELAIHASPDGETSPLLLVPMDVGDTMRDFISNFFQCDECRDHFLHEYETCDFDRCNRLVTEKTGIREDWMQLPLWLYEVHNGVNTRLRRERIGRMEETETTTKPNDVVWPSRQRCPSCWLSDGHWDEEMVYRYMRLIYWPDDKRSDDFRKLLWTKIRHNEEEERQRKQEKLEEQQKEAFLRILKQNGALLVVLGILLAIARHRKKNFDQIGLHKKSDNSFG